GIRRDSWGVFLSAPTRGYISWGGQVCRLPYCFSFPWMCPVLFVCFLLLDIIPQIEVTHGFRCCYGIFHSVLLFLVIFLHTDGESRQRTDGTADDAAQAAPSHDSIHIHIGPSFRYGQFPWSHALCLSVSTLYQRFPLSYSVGFASSK